GLDPYVGVLHRPRYGRPALGLDLAEEFRPLVADSVVVGVINNGEITPSMLIARGGAYALSPEGRRHLIEAFERRLATEIVHPLFGYRASYRRIMALQARLFARVLTGEIGEYVPFVTR
ncbi:MAG TPA: CRISPR-associated endonuclease Cas1, partial [Miltoncostaeaceae bacterium]|nr:CRISPR-associated endonuclease Cas1 [Miltoncostaeaceae bacterium]